MAGIGYVNGNFSWIGIFQDIRERFVFLSFLLERNGHLLVCSSTFSSIQLLVVWCCLPLLIQILSVPTLSFAALSRMWIALRKSLKWWKLYLLRLLINRVTKPHFVWRCMNLYSLYFNALFMYHIPLNFFFCLCILLIFFFCLCIASLISITFWTTHMLVFKYTWKLLHWLSMGRLPST